MSRPQRASKNKARKRMKKYDPRDQVVHLAAPVKTYSLDAAPEWISHVGRESGTKRARIARSLRQ